MNNKINIILLGIIAILLGVAIFLGVTANENKNNYRDQVNLYNAITDTLQTWKDKDSLNNAKIQVMQTEKASDFLKIQNLTGTNLELQNLIKSQGKRIKDLNTALIVKSETIIRDTTRIYYPIEGDTIIFSQSVLLDSIENEWITALYGFNKGRSILDFTLINDYQITIGYEGGNVFRQGIPFATIKNLNPYTITNDLRVYQTSMKKQKRIGISLQTGFGGLYNINTKTLGYGPYIGLGINYNILLW